MYTSPIQASAIGGNLIADVKFNQGITSAADCYMCMPFVSQGVGVNQRVGAEIQPLSFKLQLCLSLVGGADEVIGATSKDHGPEDITVHVFMLRSKLFPDMSQQYSLNVGSDLMCQFNGQLPQAFDGTYWASRLIPNRTLYHVLHHKKIRLRKGAGYQSYVKEVSEYGNDNPTNSLYALDTPGAQMAQLTLDIPAPKKLVYEGPFNTFPRDYAPFVCIGWVSNEFPIAKPLNQNYYPLAVTARTFFKFKDA